MQRAGGITTIQAASDVNVSLGAGVDGFIFSYDNDTGKFVLVDPSTLGGGISQIQDADDVNVSLGAGVDEYALCYDHDTTKFVLRQVTQGSCLLATGATVGASSQAQAFTNGIKSGLLYPSADSTTAIKICKANGSTVVLNVDTTNSRLGVGTDAPVRLLNVNGKALFGSATDPQPAGSTHIVDIISSGTASPLMMQGGCGVMEFWKDSSPTKAVSYGMAVPGAAITDNLQLSTYDGSSWAGRFTILSSNGYVGVGTTSPGTLLDCNLSTSATNSIGNIAQIRCASTGTPAAGFGCSFVFSLESTTTEGRVAARVSAVTVTATDASRKYKLVLSAYDIAEREGLVIEASGTAAKIGFLGTAAAAQVAHIADASTTHSITDPADSPADADALREDLVTNVIPSIESALNALGTKINAILTVPETFGLVATA